MHIIQKSIFYFQNVTRFYGTQINVTVKSTPSPVWKVWFSVRRLSWVSEWDAGVVGTLFWILCRWDERGKSALWLSQDCPLLSDCTWRVSHTELYRTDIQIYLLTAVGLTPGCSSTVHIYTKTIHRTTQLILVGRLSGIRTQSGHTKINIELTASKLSPNVEECIPCPVYTSYTLEFALQLRKKHGKTIARIAEVCQLARRKQNIQNRTCITIRIHKHNNKNT
jgi:hypothetical protein